MKRERLFALIVFVVLILVAGQSNAQILFYADFEDTKGPNNIDDWERVTPEALDFSVQDGVLKQLANEVVNTTKVSPPVDGSGWIDYTVAVDLWLRDNDILGLVFRYTDEDHYYSFQIGASDFGNTWHLNITSADDQQDWAEPAWSAQDILLQGQLVAPLGPLAAPLDQTGATAYTIAATISGNKIKVFFGPQVDILAGEMPPELGEVEDDSFSKGTTGLYIATCPSDFDNFIVLGPAGLSVAPKDKLISVWGGLKSDHR
jgi:hypothetical protein